MTSTDVLNGVLTIIPIILTVFVIPLMRAKQGTEKVKKEATTFDGWVTKAKTVVAAAKQKTDLITNDQMNAFAKKTLKAFGVPDSVLDVVIEAAVKGLKAADATLQVASLIDSTTLKATGALSGTDADTSASSEITASTDTAAHDAAAQAAAQAVAEKLTKLTSAAQAYGVTVTPDMDAEAIKSVLQTAMAA